MGYYATVIADSINPLGVRLTSIECQYPRFVHAEALRHRAFCLAGDNRLEFDLPSSNRGRDSRRCYSMSVAEFVRKWEEGSSGILAKPKRPSDLSWVIPEVWYSGPEVASRLGMHSASHIHKHCRSGEIAARRGEDGRTWMILGEEIVRWRQSEADALVFDLRQRLRSMQIRQLNEDTGDIQTARVIDASRSGLKPIHEIRAGRFTLAASVDHQILTPEGWVALGSLSAGDYVLVRKFGKRADECLDPLRLKKIDGVWRNSWQTIQRRRLIEEDPLCRRCRTRPLENVHHVVAVHENPCMALDANNITGLCIPCHAEAHRYQGWQGGTYLYGAAAKIDEIVYRGEEETYDLEIAGPYPNFLANGVIVHNSRSVASSRAIPMKRFRELVEQDPVEPIWWGKNQAGMQAYEELDDTDQFIASDTWNTALRNALNHHAYLEQGGLHKQIANRILEPWFWLTELVSGTDMAWANFFHLRCHEAAMPELRHSAFLQADAYFASTPQRKKIGEWHLPYLRNAATSYPEEQKLLVEIQVKVSTARCARVSYLNQGKEPDLESELALYERLVGNPPGEPQHVSPSEHVAMVVDGGDYEESNFGIGWLQHRKQIEGETCYSFSKEQLEKRRANIIERFGRMI